MIQLWCVYMCLFTYYALMYVYTVKVEVDGPPGQKVSALRTDKDRESGRIVGSVPPQTILSVALGYL